MKFGLVLIVVGFTFGITKTALAQTPTLSISSPNITLDDILKAKITGFSKSEANPKGLTLGEGANTERARSTMVVVPAESVNRVMNLQTNAITELSERLKAIEERLERLETNRGNKK